LHDAFRVSGFIWDAGVNYDYLFKKTDKDGKEVPTGEYVTIGLYGSSNNSFTSSRTRLYRKFNRLYGHLDTLAFENEIRGDGTLPSKIGLGLMWGKELKWQVGTNFEATQWSNYRNDAQPDVLQDAWNFSVGGEWIPNVRSYNSYVKRIRYRAGLYYGTDPREDSNGEQLTDYGANLGFGLPVILPQGRTSFVSFSFNFGQFGSDNAIRETYTRFSVGFTLNDSSWFLKRKFN